MAEFALPRTDEPFDFRHQAAIYARYRRDYSSALYEASTRVVMDVLRATDTATPPDFEQLRVHQMDPFAGSKLESVPSVVLQSNLAFSADEFHGYISTVEWIRRFAGAKHAEFLARLREALAERHRDGVTERNEEYLFLARKPG